MQGMQIHKIQIHKYEAVEIPLQSILKPGSLERSLVCSSRQPFPFSPAAHNDAPYLAKYSDFTLLCFQVFMIEHKSWFSCPRDSQTLLFWRDSMSDLDFCQHQTLAHSHPLCSAFGDDETIKADSASFASFTEFCLRSLPSWWDIMNISASETVWLVYDE